MDGFIHTEVESWFPAAASSRKWGVSVGRAQSGQTQNRHAYPQRLKVG